MLKLPGYPYVCLFILHLFGLSAVHIVDVGLLWLWNGLAIETLLVVWSYSLQIAQRQAHPVPKNHALSVAKPLELHNYNIIIVA
jgi:hypothetical protein